jgi:hypothetical protein
MNKGIININVWSFSTKIFFIAGSRSQAIDEVLAATRTAKKTDNNILLRYLLE